MAGSVAKVNPPVELVSVTVKPTSDWALSFAGPTLMPEAKPATVCAPASSLLEGLAARLNVGESLIALTVIVKVLITLVLLLGGGPPGPLSRNVTLKVAVPLELSAD